MKNKTLLFVGPAVTLLILLNGGALSAQTRLIDFETYPGDVVPPSGDPLTTQFEPWGASPFSCDTGPPTMLAASFAGMSGSYVLRPVCCWESYDVTFTSPVSDVSILALDVGSGGLMLEAFDASDALVGEAQVVNESSGTGNADTLSVIGDQIARIAIRQVTVNGSDGFVIDDLQFTPGCEPNCDTCDGWTCTTCNDGWFLFAGDCIECTTCATGYYENVACGAETDTDCQPCYATCMDCDGPSAMDCTACATGTYDDLEGDDFNCAACTTCATGYYESVACGAETDTDCQPCFEGCTECGGPNAIDCTTCVTGYWDSDDTGGVNCTLCGEHCANCVSATTCLACDDGSYYAHEGSCADTCPPGFFGDADAGICVACEANCLTCDDEETCTGCAPGFFGESADCSACHTSCAECGSGESTGCTVCRPDDLFRDGVCYPAGDADGDELTNEQEDELGTDPLDADTDDDGLSDGDEIGDDAFYDEGEETDPLDADTDDDGIQDGTELGTVDGVGDPDDDGPMKGTNTEVFVPDGMPESTTDPLDPDSDLDGVDDGDEDLNGNGEVDDGESDATDPCTPNPNHSLCATGDIDADAFTNAEEEVAGTDPTNSDTDNDGLSDGTEVNGNTSTDPLDPDTDNDGLCDGSGDGPAEGDGTCEGGENGEDSNGDGIVDDDETDPTDTDTDDDGLTDFNELMELDTDPNNTDSDGDGIQDGTELDVTDQDISDDTDTEVFISDEDPATSTDPNDVDTDDDGLADGIEDANHNGRVDDGESDPNNPDDADCVSQDDCDGDGLTDREEAVYGTDPHRVDTDGGGISDYDEILAGADPFDDSDDIVVSMDDLDLEGGSGFGCSIVAYPAALGAAALLLLLGIAVLSRRRRAS